MILTIQQPVPAARAFGCGPRRAADGVGWWASGRPGVHAWTSAAKAGQEWERGGLSRPSSVGSGTAVACTLRGAIDPEAKK